MANFDSSNAVIFEWAVCNVGNCCSCRALLVSRELLQVGTGILGAPAGLHQDPAACAQLRAQIRVSAPPGRKQ